MNHALENSFCGRFPRRIQLSLVFPGKILGGPLQKKSDTSCPSIRRWLSPWPNCFTFFFDYRHVGMELLDFRVWRRATTQLLSFRTMGWVSVLICLVNWSAIARRLWSQPRTHPRNNHVCILNNNRTMSRRGYRSNRGGAPFACAIVPGLHESFEPACIPHELP